MGELNPTESSIVQQSYRGLVKVCSTTDKYSTWILTICGATIALMFTNYNNISQIILNKASIKECFESLVTSVFFGLVAKVLTYTVLVYDAIYEHMATHLSIARSNASNSHMEVDITKVFSEYSKAFPWPLGRLVKYLLIKKPEIMFNANRRAANKVVWQLIIILIQSFFFLLFIIEAVDSLP